MKRHEQGTLAGKWEALYFQPHRPIFELYDLESDPFEMRNLAGTAAMAKVEFDLRMALTEWMLLERDHVPLPAPDAPPER